MKKLYTIHNATISYRIEGEGENVVLLHGFGEDSSIWEAQVNYLKNHCRLIVLDLPGSGESVFYDHERVAKVSSYSPSTIEYYADCVLALLLHQNITQCMMLGHSLGGYITLAFAEKYSRYLIGWGLIHSTAFADSHERKQSRVKSIALIEEYGSYAFLKNTTPILFGKEFKKNHPAKVDALIENGNKFSKLSLCQYCIAMKDRQDRIFVLENSIVPVLFVIGSEDVAAPMTDVLQQVHLPKIAYIHILENIGHMGMLEATERLNAIMLAFIKGFISTE